MYFMISEMVCQRIQFKRAVMIHCLKMLSQHFRRTIQKETISVPSLDFI